MANNSYLHATYTQIRRTLSLIMLFYVLELFIAHAHGVSADDTNWCIQKQWKMNNTLDSKEKTN